MIIRNYDWMHMFNNKFYPSIAQMLPRCTVGRNVTNTPDFGARAEFLIDPAHDRWNRFVFVWKPFNGVREGHHR